jgi:hypothetical protein
MKRQTCDRLPNNEIGSKVSASQRPPDSQDIQSDRIEKPPVPVRRDAQPHLEWTRLYLAVGFSAFYLLLIPALVIHTLTVTWAQDVQQRLTAIAATLLSPLGALVGGIIGFYFGSKSGS